MIRRGVIAALILCATVATAQDADDAVLEGAEGRVEPVSGFTGQMSMTMEAGVPEDMAVTEVIRFEPWQMLDEIFRDDLVFVMRAGPTDWDASDDPEAGPMECDRQRRLSEAGAERMRQLGALMIVNGIRPGAVRVSRWCRAQETYAAMERGMLATGKRALDGMDVAGAERLAPVGAAHGAVDAEGLLEAAMAWEGGEDGPLLLVTDFPNIEGMTRFNTYEGEMLIVDPKRGGRVLGYLRLGSAEPDPIHFDPWTTSAAGD